LASKTDRRDRQLSIIERGVSFASQRPASSES
jgi:hypothetical protein